MGHASDPVLSPLAISIARGRYPSYVCIHFIRLAAELPTGNEQCLSVSGANSAHEQHKRSARERKRLDSVPFIDQILRIGFFVTPFYRLRARTRT